jgi:hypothetical protein
VCLNGNTLPAQRPERTPFEELLRRATVATMPEQELREGIEKYRQRALAAETALASAREVIERWETEPPEVWTVMRADWLTSHPAPVAAPCAGCAAARELLVLWYHNRAETESGELIEVATQNWLKEHGNG